MAEYESDSIYRPPEQTVKYANTLELLETQRDIYRLELKMGGYIEVKKEGQPFLIRQEGLRPYWADDVVKKISEHLSFMSNLVTSQVSWTLEEIKMILRHNHRRFIMYLNSERKENSITPQVWDKILDIHKMSYVQQFKQYDDNGKLIKEFSKIVSGWYKITGKDWTKDSPVSRSMIIYARKDIQDESDQKSIAQLTQSDVFTFCDGSLRRSMDGLTLKHHQSTTTTHRHEFKDDRPKSAIQAVGQQIQGQ